MVGSGVLPLHTREVDVFALAKAGTAQRRHRPVTCRHRSDRQAALATRCDRVSAFDGSPTVVAMAARRLTGFANVELSTASLPGYCVRVDLDLHLDAGALVGPVGWYLDRPGFWWGAAGVAPVWAGGAAGLLARLLPRWRDDPISLAHLGAAHAGVKAAPAMAMAVAIDAPPGGMPKEQAARLAYSARHVADLTVGAVIDHVSRALGPAPAAQDSAPHPDSLTLATLLGELAGLLGPAGRRVGLVTRSPGCGAGRGRRRCRGRSSRGTGPGAARCRRC